GPAYLLNDVEDSLATRALHDLEARPGALEYRRREGNTAALAGAALDFGDRPARTRTAQALIQNKVLALHAFLLSPAPSLQLLQLFSGQLFLVDDDLRIERCDIALALQLLVDLPDAPFGGVNSRVGFL